ncbi:tape measure protein [Spirosoma areae]
MRTSGPLDFEATLTDVSFRSQLDAMERRILGLVNTAERGTAKIDDSFKRLSQLATGYFSLSVLSEFSRQLVRTRGEMQALEIAFTTLLGSKAKADAFLKEGVEFANKTPFELGDVTKAQKVMLAYGFSVQSILPTLTKLGDIAAGTGSDLQGLVLAYGQIKTQGIAQQDDINKFIERGVNLLPELSRILKIAESDVRKYVEAGKVGFKDVEQAITDLTNGAGKLNFGGLMAEQAKSLNGLTSNLSDAWSRMLNQIGKDNEAIIAESIKGAITLVDNYAPVLDALKVIIATYGTYKAATIALAVAQSASAAAGLANVRAWFQLAIGIRSAADAQALFNLTTKANPYVLAATALVALTTALVVYKKELTATQVAEQALEKARSDANSEATKEVSKIELLKNTINNEKISRQQRNKALEELIALSPDHLKALTLENVRTADGTKAINEYVEALSRKIEKQKLDAELAEHLSKRSDAFNNKNDLSFLSELATGAALSEGAFNGNVEKARADKKKQLNEQIAKSEQVIIDKILERNRALDETGAKGVKNEQVVQAAKGKTIEQIEEEIKATKKLINETNTDAQNAAFRKQIEELERRKRRLTGELTPKEKQAQREAEKTGPFGSLSYYEAVSRHFDELIAKTPKTDTAKLTQFNTKKLEADKQAEAIRKSLAVKSFDDELTQKRQQYELYQKWVTAYGQAAADQQFNELKKSGGSYVDYLDNQIAKLEKKKQDSGKLTDVDLKSLGQLTDERNDLTGKKNAVDLYRESLELLRNDTQTTSEYITSLQKKLSELNPNDTSPTGIAKRIFTADELNQAQRQLQAELNQYLTSVKGSEGQRLAITQKYANLRASVEEKYKNDRGAAYQSAIKEINKSESEELKSFKRQAAEASDAFKELTKVIEEEGRKALKIQIQRERAVLKDIEKDNGKTSELYREQAKIISGLVENLDRDSLNTFNAFATVIGQAGEELSQLGGEAGKAGQFLVGLTSKMNLLTQAFEDSFISDTERVQLGIQGAVGLLSSLATAAAQRKKAEVEYYTAIIAQQQQYNLLLNEQIGLRAKSQENVFVKDYAGELEDNFKKFDDAQKKYQESLKKLNEGRAKIGTENTIDWSAVGKGAIQGAMIGSAIPVIGTIIGGIVGGITGLFGGKKAEDEFGSLLQAYPELIKKSKDGVNELNVSLAETLLNQNLVDDSTKQLLQSTIDWQKQMDEAKEAVTGIVRELAGALGDKLRDNLVNAFKEGTDAALAFKSAVEGILEDLVTKLLFSKVFNTLFDKLEEDIKTSLSPGGDQQFTDDFAKFFKDAGPSIEAYNKALQQFREQAKASGFDVLSPTGTSINNPATAQSRAIQGVTEATASVVTGQINAMRIQQAQTNLALNQSILHLAGIERNTGESAKYAKYLESIDRRLETISSNPGRGVGMPG